jgi:hypothetical protein
VPALPVVAPQFQVVALPRHSGDDVADAALCVEPAMDYAQLGLGRRHEREADGGGEEAGARASSSSSRFN